MGLSSCEGMLSMVQGREDKPDSNRIYLVGKGLQQPALAQGDRQACAVEDPQGARHSEGMCTRGWVIAMAQQKTGRAVFSAVLVNLYTGFAHHLQTKVFRPANDEAA